MSGTTMAPGRTSMNACPSASGANAKPATLARKAMSSAKNIDSAPTSTPVRAR